jgi:16S rRNA (guanine1207-N2)-methyltransferase
VGSDAGEHYFSPSPAGRSRPREVPYVARFGGGELLTDRATFSPDRIDLGTRVLLAEVPDPPPTGTFADLGCGYGPIAVALATAAPQSRVIAVDVNQRARDLCAENAERRGLRNIEVHAPEDLDPDLRFDLIWSNPPIRIGKQALHELLVSWLERLAPDGAAYLVVQRHLGAETLADWLGGEGWNVSRFKAKKGFRVLHVTRPT